MLRRFVTAGVSIVLVGVGSDSAAQQADGTVIPCRVDACGLLIDWRGTTPGSGDRRYGNPSDFATVLQRRLLQEGYQFVLGLREGDNAINVRLVPELTRAICDTTPGTNTDRSCRTIGLVNVEFLNVEPRTEINDRLRVQGNCGSDGLMEIVPMAEYVAAMIDYELHGRQGRDRPRARC